MGVDPGHMSYERLAQSIPPDYAQLIASQMCMREAERKFGVPAITFDDYRERPGWARTTLARWLRGAGDDRVHAGLSIEFGMAQGDEPVREGPPLASGPSSSVSLFPPLLYPRLPSLSSLLLYPRLPCV